MEQTIVVEVSKPRAKQVNDVLLSKHGGRHFDPKKDYKRAKERSKVRKEIAALTA